MPGLPGEDYAAAATQLLKLINYSVIKDKHGLIQEALQRGNVECEKFKNHLIGGDYNLVQLMLDGLQGGHRVNLTTHEADILKSITVTNSGYDWLGYFCRAREVQTLTEIIAILSTKSEES